MTFTSQIVIVTLRGHNIIKRSTKVTLDTNQFGQLPTVLVNPRSDAGRTLSGLWLGDPQDFGADGTTYRWLTVAHAGLGLTWADSDIE
ncbi:hypothetical protein E3T41_16090 [Cryobacterium sp. Hh38]|nr:hypothetical protein E3T41_16090 [Cryobacterium sp. Hh38]